MNLFRLLAAAAAAAVIIAAFRDFEDGEWLAPGGDLDFDLDDSEPVLGYDGMDPDTLIPWLEDADLDRETLERIERYERANQSRGRVLEVISELLREPVRY